MKSGIIKLVDKASRLSGQRISGPKLDHLAEEFETVKENVTPAELFIAAWRNCGLNGTPVHLYNPMPTNLPFVVYHNEIGWIIIKDQKVNGEWLGINMSGESVSIDEMDDLVCTSIPQQGSAAASTITAFKLIAQTAWSHKKIFLDSIVASSLIALLALVTSLYSMQVFDRVIPNQGFNTLWVLSVGVIVSICLEFLLKQTRSYMVDRASNQIDRHLSGWFFNRMLGIRMESRPTSVGTMAAQVKGFEMVRGVMASTSLFILADVPFALLFLFVIALVGGWVAIVPLIALPIALMSGVVFQKVIQHHTRMNLSASNRKAGLLVEAVDGAESLKASNAEWTIQARWDRLVDETMQAEQSIRNYSSFSQNMTVWLQQISYVALIATGAYFVAENEMTMGALLACSILGNRAMTPIVQLPGVMVQWALAKAAVEGLEAVVKLPNEADEADHTLVPEIIESSFRFERIRFAYGEANRVALEIERMEIKAGESVGLVGPIGSGKSTLLKLASGLYRPNEGKVFLGGIDMAIISPIVVRENIGYLPQDIRLFSGTLRANLILGLPDPGEEAILAAARRTGLMDLISGQPKGLALELTEGGRGVSGGQKQLIGLTRMLLAKPKIWLLDEPTGAMDAVNEARIVNLIKELIEEGITLIVTTHKTALLPLLSRLIVLQGGRVLVDGPRDDVMAKLSNKPKSEV